MEATGGATATAAGAATVGVGATATRDSVNGGDTAAGAEKGAEGDDGHGRGRGGWWRTPHVSSPQVPARSPRGRVVTRRMRNSVRTGLGIRSGSAKIFRKSEHTPLPGWEKGRGTSYRTAESGMGHMWLNTPQMSWGGCDNRGKNLPQYLGESWITCAHMHLIRQVHAHVANLWTRVYAACIVRANASRV